MCHLDRDTVKTQSLHLFTYLLIFARWIYKPVLLFAFSQLAKMRETEIPTNESNIIFSRYSKYKLLVEMFRYLIIYKIYTVVSNEFLVIANFKYYKFTYKLNMESFKRHKNRLLCIYIFFKRTS